MDPLESLSIKPPVFAVPAVATAVEEQYGLRGEYESLVSERDQNFRLEATDGKRFVVKISSQVESPETSDFQIAAMLHLRDADDVHAPMIVPCIDGRVAGEISAAEARYRLRVVSWLEGEQLQSCGIDEALAHRFGAALAQLDRALSDFSHPGESPLLVWDLQRLPQLRPLLGHIDDAAIQAAVTRAIDDYESNVIPVMRDLPSQVIHSDANPENVLLMDSGIGFIDFGDIVRAPRVFEPAIAASYLRSFGADPAALIRPFIDGYTDRMPLSSLEMDLFFDLLRGRLATTITLLYWRLRDRQVDDEYRQKSLELESSASQFLDKLNQLGRKEFYNKFR